MEDFWKKAKSLAEEAAKKSQSLADSSKLADLVSETAKKSKELAAQASKKADLIKIAALNQAHQIKSLSDNISIPNFSDSLSSSSSSDPSFSQSELHSLGVTDELRSFVKGLTSSTFQNFPIKSDEGEASDAATSACNVRKDLNEFQEKHATLVLTTVKEISRLRYELCPRVMKERHFWKIYFTLVNTHVAPYEKRYLEDIKLRAAAEQKVDDNKVEKTAVAGGTEEVETSGKSVKSKSSKSSSTEQDLDTFLLGDLEDSDGDDGEGSLDDDFDKIENSDVEEDKQVKKESEATN